MGGSPSQGIPIGRRVRNYEIVAGLGAGGMGVVYKARDLKLDRFVALKFLRPAASGDREKRRLLREARAASTLDHVNIGTIYGIEEDCDDLFIVMAYYEGETLLARLRRGPLAAAAVVRFGIAIAQGLAHAHAKGIVHRDIKPSNILVTTGGVVKIVDFGLAQMPSAATLTETGTVLGTAAYMSPEQVKGMPLDARTDIWSFGAMLYEMLTGVLPFRGTSLHSMLYNIVNDAPLPLAGVPPELEGIVLRCLSKNIADRYASAADLLHDLREMEAPSASDSTLTLAQPSDATVARGRWPPWKLASAGAIALAILAIALLLTPARQTISRWMGFGETKRHIAVIPFRNVGNDPANEALCDGLTETLTSSLSDFQDSRQSIWVVPSALVRRKAVTDGAAARREFGATLIVAGSVQRSAGGGVRLIVALQETSRPRVIDSAVLDEKSGDLLSLQDAAVAKLAAMMHLRPARRAAPAGGGPAYESYLEGLGYMQRYDRPGNLDRAIQAFQNALRTDDRFALADAGLGEVYRKQYELTRDPSCLPKATDYCSRATALDAQLTPAYITLGRVHVSAGQLPLAVEEFRRALGLDPQSPDAMQGLASAYQLMGRAAEAEDLFKRAAALQPDFWDGYNRLGTFYYTQHRYEDAIRQFRRVIELTPDNAAGLSNLAAVLIESQRYAEAEPLLEKAIRLAPSYPLYSNLGLVYMHREQYPNAITTFRKALTLNDRDYRLWSNLALAYTYSGADAQAREAFERAATLAEGSVRLQPQNATLQASLAKYYAFLGKSNEALFRLNAALARAPDDQQVLHLAAEVYERLGMRKQAVAAANRAVDRGYSWEQLQQDRELMPLLKEPALKKK